MKSDVSEITITVLGSRNSKQGINLNAYSQIPTISKNSITQGIQGVQLTQNPELLRMSTPRSEHNSHRVKKKGDECP